MKIDARRGKRTAKQRTHKLIQMCTVHPSRGAQHASADERARSREKPQRWLGGNGGGGGALMVDGAPRTLGGCV